MLDIKIEMKGAAETALYLKAFERDIYDVLAKQVRAILSSVRGRAQAKYPAGSWSISFGSGRWPAGMIGTSGGSSRDYRSWAEAPGGVKAAIFDTYGRRTSIDSMATPAARATGRHMEDAYGKPQRFLWPAWKEGQAESWRAIEKAFEDAESSLQSRIDRAS